MDVAHALRIGQQIVRNLFAREVLDEAPPSSHPATRRRTSLLRALFEPEVLGTDVEPAPPPSRRRALWRALLAPEPLAVDPEPAPASPRRRTLAQDLFAPERLPEEPTPAPRRQRARWLRWLVVPESLDPPP